MTIKTFVEKLVETGRSCTDVRGCKNALHSSGSPEELLSYGHACGWLEDSDERFPENSLDRRTAARIIHQFLRICCGIPDLPEIPNARALKDLYVCPSCANHIAQVYERGIMNAMQITDADYGSSENSILIFNHLEQVSEQDVKSILQNVSAVLNRLK